MLRSLLSLWSLLTFSRWCLLSFIGSFIGIVLKDGFGLFARAWCLELQI
jgi:hypothetical protein